MDQNRRFEKQCKISSLYIFKFLIFILYFELRKNFTFMTSKCEITCLEFSDWFAVGKNLIID
jgi:hypothetical protein